MAGDYLFELQLLVQLEAGHPQLDTVIWVYAWRRGQKATLWLQLQAYC